MRVRKKYLKEDLSVSEYTTHTIREDSTYEESGVLENQQRILKGLLASYGRLVETLVEKGSLAEEDLRYVVSANRTESDYSAFLLPDD